MGHFQHRIGPFGRPGKLVWDHLVDPARLRTSSSHQPRLPIGQRREPKRSQQRSPNFQAWASILDNILSKLQGRPLLAKVVKKVKKVVAKIKAKKIVTGLKTKTYRGRRPTYTSYHRRFKRFIPKPWKSKRVPSPQSTQRLREPCRRLFAFRLVPC